MRETRILVVRTSGSQRWEWPGGEGDGTRGVQAAWQDKVEVKMRRMKRVHMMSEDGSWRASAG